VVADKSAADKISDFTGAIIVLFFVIACIFFMILRFIKEILIPFLIGLFFVLLGVVLAITLVRLLVHLIAYLTFKKRSRLKIAALSKQIFELDAHDSTRQQRMSDWPTRERHANQARLQQHALTREELNTKRQNRATALADYLANRLETVNRSRRKLARKTAAGVNVNLSQKLARQDTEASLLEVKINRLRRRYYIEPDPAFERKERMYPVISGFDRFVSNGLKRCWARIARVQPDSL